MRGKSKRRTGRVATTEPAGNSTGVVLLLISAAVIVALFVLWMSWDKRESIDKVSLCPSSGPSGAIVFIIDATDGLTAFQRTAIRAEFERLIRDAPSGTMISFGIVSPDESVRNARRFGFCKPPEGSEADPMFENRNLFERRFKNEFMKPLTDAMDEFLDTGKAKNSPIMETIQAVIAGVYTRLPDGGSKQLVIASDMLQHSDAFSFYRGETWESFRRSNAFGRLGRNLSGVKVVLLRLPNPKSAALQGPPMIKFWWSYFEAQGVASVVLNTIGDL